MSTTQKPSEHALKAASLWYMNRHIEDMAEHELVSHIDQHAIAPAVAERDKRIAELERENNALRAKVAGLEQDKARLDWLQQFLQIGGSSVFSSPTGQAVKQLDDDTDETRWNHPFHIGYEVEIEHRGCYRWEELSNGAKGIRQAIDAARSKE